MAQILDHGLSEAGIDRRLAADYAAIALQVGDKITARALPDRRSWWQRAAPKWLGGRDAPQPLNAVITATATGGR